jgi:hypothetical protein
MNPLDSFYSMFGTMGVIALILSLFFATAAMINAWRRKVQSQPPPPKAGPILMSDPHSGALVTQLEELPLPPEPLPAPDASVEEKTEPKPPSINTLQYFRQLDGRGGDGDATRGAKNDDYVWE